MENKPASAYPSLHDSSGNRFNTLEYYATRANFNIGVHLTKDDIQGAPQAAASGTGYQVVTEEYRGMTLDFSVDWKYLEPQEGQYNFQGIDMFVDFARKNGVTLHHSHLLWGWNRDSYPDWVFPDRTENSCGTRTKAELERIVQAHIQSVIHHADNDIVVSWNVENEAFNERGELRRGNCFYQILGPDYIDQLFQYAREATPTGTLILNETFRSDTAPGGLNLEMADSFFNYVAAAKARGVPIDAVGIQNHLRSPNSDYFGPEYLKSLRYILDRARSAGVKAMITEMDVYQGNHSQDDVRRVYQETVATCLADTNCVWLNTWGISDARTWLRSNMVGLPDAKPLLFDENYDRKPAYYGVLEALQDAASR